MKLQVSLGLIFSLSAGFTYAEIKPIGGAARNLEKIQVTPNSDSTSTTQNKKKQKTAREKAFDSLLETSLPLKPHEIVTLHKKFDQVQAAIATPPKAPPRPVSSTMSVDLSPGASPPLIRLATGFVTSMVFLDATGQSWPVANYSLGNPKEFNIQWDKKTNALFVQSIVNYSSANLAVRLQGLDTPVMISMVSGQREVDYRVDLQIKGRGPNAQAPISGSTAISTPNSGLINVLDGIAPPGSTEVQVTDASSQAWVTEEGSLLLRTKLTLLSPAWQSTISSPDGTKVYEIPKTPLLLASRNGRAVKILVKDL